MKEIHVSNLLFILFPFISFTASNLNFFNLDLREHAIFTLRNLLENNRENQQFVHSLKPSQEWDDDGTLNTIAGAVLK
jgi:Spinocerebellar ataxia type 10 protein domain